MKIEPIKNYNLYSNYSRKDKKSFVTSVPKFNTPFFTSKSQYIFPNNQTKEVLNYLKTEISKTFQVDKNFINKHYFGNIDNENKFLKYGYYALISENKSNLNIRQLNQNYEYFYNKNLKSLYDVGSGRKKYSKITLDNNKSVNSWFKYLNVSDISTLNNKIREEYQAGNLDNLVKYSIQNNFNENYQKLPIHKVYTKDIDFRSNILSLNQEKIHSIFIIINDYINNSSKKEYSEIYKYLDEFADGVYSQNETIITNSYNKIINIIKPFYDNNHKIREIQESKLIKDFENSEIYKNLNRNFNLDLLFKTDILSNEEKIFLISKKDKNYGIDLYKFLIDNPTNNKIRKQIINNLILAENADKQAFKIMKKIFISDINSGNTKNITPKLLDSVINQTDRNSLNFISNEDKIEYLKQFPDEELNFLLENIKEDWLKKRAEEAFEFEANKYDIDSRVNNLTKDITIKIDNTKIDLSNIIKELTENLSQKINTSEKSIANLLGRHDSNMVRQIYNQNRQMEKITEILCSNTQESREIKKQISLVLDKIEQNSPDKKKEVDMCRVGLRKFSGLASIGIGIGRIIGTQGFDLGGFFNIIYGLNTIFL